MITVIYSTHKDINYNLKFQEHIKKTIGVKDYQILEYQNFNQFSLAEIYNRGISEANNDIIVCCHNDIKLETGWGKKLIQDFSNNPEFGIIGKAGSCYFPESGVYWERMAQTMVGQVYHHPQGQNKWLSKYSPKFPFLIPVVTVDGLFIAFDKTKIKHQFDETIGKFHFYDHGFCVPNYLDGVKLGVTTSFDITHESIGMPNDEFYVSKNQFVEKYKENLPLDLKPSKVYVPEIKEKPLKGVGKIAVIIPTKGNVEMLFDCVNSFYEHCNSELFDIFIADTGSTDIEKEWIKTNIIPLGNVKLIEYDYYNFAKINNDVVKNHIDDSYEFLLFSNKDIKLLNNVVYGMLKIFKENKNTGTVGCRLHFEDNTVQHDGILTMINKNNHLLISHKNFRNYYNHSLSQLEDVIGNTAALMMIRKKTFEIVGMFNENYKICFEDVELNYKCKIMGYNNLFNGSLVAYHYESLTRNLNLQNKEFEMQDFKERILPFVQANYNKLTKNFLFER
jgi:GT2 family glycosyltransferase